MLAAVCSEAAKGSPSCNDLAGSIESSHVNFGHLHRVSKTQMLILLKARLFLITCSTNVLHRTLEDSLWKKYRRRSACSSLSTSSP